VQIGKKLDLPDAHVSSFKSNSAFLVELDVAKCFFMFVGDLVFKMSPSVVLCSIHNTRR
jgi:hypothetical protein